MQYFLWLRHKILVCFSSSSVAIVVPTLRELKVKSRVKSIMTSAIFLEDVASLILIAVLCALFIFLLVVLYLISILQEWLLWLGPKKDAFTAELR